MKLRKLKEKDADKMLAWMHDAGINDIFAKNFASLTKADVIKFIKNSQQDSKNIHLACVNDDDEYLGTVSLKNIDQDDKNAEYAISFTSEARGTGAAKFATHEILRVAFEDLKLHKVYLDVLDSNLRAIKFYYKIGFVLEGTAKEHISKNNTFHDLLWFRLLSSEYKKISTEKQDG